MGVVLGVGVETVATGSNIVQSLDFTDPVGDLGVSLGQSEHGADPVNALYFPA